VTPPYLAILERENLWGYRKRLQFMLRTVVHHFPARAPHAITILDVGCGNGTMLALPLAYLGYRVTGLDVDAASVVRARELTGSLSAQFLCCDLEALAPPVRFDVVICSEVLEHVDDPAALLRGCATRLNPKGLLLVTVPNGHGPFEIESRIYRRLRLERIFSLARRWLRRRRGGSGTQASTENIESGHQHFFTQRQLRELFDTCGLRIEARSGGSLFCGPFSEAVLRWFPWLFGLNAKVTDYLPAVFHSSWYFALVPETEGH